MNSDPFLIKSTSTNDIDCALVKVDFKSGQRQGMYVHCYM